MAYDINDYAEAAMRLYGVKIGEFLLARAWGSDDIPTPLREDNGTYHWPDNAPPYVTNDVQAEVERAHAEQH